MYYIPLLKGLHLNVKRDENLLQQFLLAHYKHQHFSII